MAKKWSELTPVQQKTIVGVGGLEALLKVIALVDLKRRPEAQVRGNKKAWALALGPLNSAGLVPLAYLLWGRRR